LFFLASAFGADAALVSGTVLRANEAVVMSGARVTLFTPNLKFFREVRSGADGAFAFANVPSGTYQLIKPARAKAYSL